MATTLAARSPKPNATLANRNKSVTSTTRKSSSSKIPAPSATMNCVRASTAPAIPIAWRCSAPSTRTVITLVTRPNAAASTIDSRIIPMK